ncbi:metal ABC transporter solute-binding protein, Zn/Mn family [Bacillus testis]|uniref:metal ABC transporter solute-binding protein, Zn/Mn family n=1 Tax=Bacillus testis TaxID=1622072 RepID=UPI00067EAE27|nr:zinc ABC transporter substrate-binding protein [Bacillus testis]
MYKKQIFAFVLIFAAFLSGCGNKDESTSKQDKEKLSVYTTVYPLQYLTEQIGGPYVDVKSVYPPGADEHSFEPSQKDLISMAQADNFFYIGHHLEGFVTKAKPILTKEGVTMDAVGEKIDHSKLQDAHEHGDEDHDHDGEDHKHEEDGHDHGDINPHVWLDPSLMVDMATEIKNQLAEQKPDQKQYFEESYDKVVNELNELDKEYAAVIEKAPKKEIIVSHAAYGYWEKRYGLKQIAVSGISSSSEPSQKALKGIMETAKEHNINYVLFEQNIPSNLTKIIQKEIDAKALHLHNLSVLTEKDIEQKKDYMSIMHQNLETLKTALY